MLGGGHKDDPTRLGGEWVDPEATVEPGVILGAGTRVWARAHLRRGATLGAECVIGDGVFIDQDVHIGDRCKLLNNALIFHGAEIEDGVFVGPAACLTNDRRPRSTNPNGSLKGTDDWTLTGVTLRRGAAVGAHAVVLAGVEVGHHAMVGAGAVVTRDVAPHALVSGNPARFVSWVCECGAGLGDDLVCPDCQRHYGVAGEGLELLAP